jgi:hypothetical protein
MIGKRLGHGQTQTTLHDTHPMDSSPCAGVDAVAIAFRHVAPRDHQACLRRNARQIGVILPIRT